jgi:benzoyl-CoA reductase/2-hydroxyglutaryl-CoA dehydratase subunit BcrC/BadD/HgdB
MTGLENLKVLYGVGFKFDYPTRMEETKTIIRQIREEYQNGARKVPASAKRILVTGCPLSGATEKVVRTIEESGGVVVAYENCTGIKPLEGLVDESMEPYRAIAERYLQIGCSVMSPDANRFALLDRLTDEFHVDGVVEMTLQACHTYAMEAAEVRQAMQKKNIPYIHVETDYSTTDIEQLRTRIGAFIEMIS